MTLGDTMGRVYAEIRLSNPRESEAHATTTRALVDTGALMLCIPVKLAKELHLSTKDTRTITVADGRQIIVPYVGPIKVVYQNRYCYVGALAFGEQVLLGAVPLEDMDLVVDPARLQLAGRHPDSPHYQM